MLLSGIFNSFAIMSLLFTMVAKEIMPRAYNRGRTSPASSFFAQSSQYGRLKAHWNESAVAQASAILRGNTAAVM